MLRKIRITLAALFFIGITLLLLDFTGTLHHWLGWMAKVQFLPALLALNAVVLVALVVLTLVFGRIYCSVICPLGVMQDVISHLNRKKNRFTHSRALTWLRLLMLVVMAIAIIAGLGSLMALLAPYSSYGRIVNNLLQPLYIWCNNGLAAIAEHYESYAFYGKDVWIKSLPTFLVAVVTFVVIAILAWRGGRTYCNTICPVGTVLGYLAKFSWFKIYFDVDKCRSCGLCTKNCKASCIDFKSHTVDYTRCVACGNCLEKCNFDALHYGHAGKTEKTVETENSEVSQNPARRAFLLGGAIVAADVALAQAGKKVDGGLAEIIDRTPPKRATQLTPPGSVSAKHMAQHCTACQLCVAQCPNDVLRPSGNLLTLMQPTLSYEHGFCRPECTRCSEVCPTGAIRPIDTAQKTTIQVGHAVWIKENCVVLTDGVNCGNCARHCPSKAIMMVPSDPDDDESPMVPAVDHSKCIGCGACEYVCPARPFGAIYVEGNEVHSSL